RPYRIVFANPEISGLQVFDGAAAAVDGNRVDANDVRRGIGNGRLREGSGRQRGGRAGAERTPEQCHPVTRKPTSSFASSPSPALISSAYCPGARLPTCISIGKTLAVVAGA